MRAALLLALFAGGCVAAGGAVPDPAPTAAPALPYERFLVNPTEVRAEEVRFLAPAACEAEIRLSGLTSGWREGPGGRTWEGTGDCRLTLRALSVGCRRLTVTLVPSGEPEVLLSAEGAVAWSHTVRGVTTFAEDLSLLVLRNDRSLER